MTLKKKSFLNKKQCAKMVKDLYETVYNRLMYGPIFIGSQLDEDRYIAYYYMGIPEYIAWCNENETMYFVENMKNLNDLSESLKHNTEKMPFLFWVLSPLLKYKKRTDNVSISETLNFALKNNIFDGIKIDGVFIDSEEELKKWLFRDREILLEDAEKIIENIKKWHQ